jgi:signal transduction histidine kinase
VKLFLPVAGQLAAGVLAASLVELALLVPLALPWPVLAGLVGTSALVAMLVVSSYLIALVRRAAPLLARARELPPSRAVLRDLFRAPTHAAATLLAGQLVWAVSPWVLGDTDAIRGPMLLAITLMSVAAGCAEAVVARRVVRLTVDDWLRPFTPDELECGMRRSTARGLGLDLGLAALAGGLAVIAVTLASTEQTTWSSDLTLRLATSFVVAAVGAAVAAYGGALLGRRWDRELETLAERLKLLVDATEDRVTAVAFNVPGAFELADAVNELADRLGERAAAEDRARQSIEDLQRSKTHFMASMSHDLRSPLNAILGFSELLSTSSDLTPAQRESIDTITESGGELLQLLNDVVDSARFEAGRLPLYREWTPSVEILTEAVRLGRQVIDRSDLKLEAELQPGLPPVYVDRERIVQAVLCLFRHAARAMTHGTVQLIARVARGPNGDEVRVAVIDRSQGIRAEDRERIFEAFREIAEPSGRRIGGMGLGLSLARALVNAHGGEVFCESREHEGTTFTVSLPIQGAAKPRAAREESRQPARGAVREVVRGPGRVRGRRR